MSASDSVSPLDRWRTYAICLAGWMFDFYDLMLFAYLASAIAKETGSLWSVRRSPGTTIITS